MFKSREIRVIIILLSVAQMWLSCLLFPQMIRLVQITSRTSTGLSAYQESSMDVDDVNVYDSVVGFPVQDPDANVVEVEMAEFENDKSINYISGTVEFGFPRIAINGNLNLETVDTEVTNGTVTRQTLYIVPDPDFGLFRDPLDPAEPTVQVTGYIQEVSLSDEIDPRPQSMQMIRVPLQESIADYIVELFSTDINFLNVFVAFFILQFTLGFILYVYLLWSAVSKPNDSHVASTVIASIALLFWFVGFCIGTITNNLLLSTSDYFGDSYLTAVFLTLAWLLLLLFFTLVRVKQGKEEQDARTMSI